MSAKTILLTGGSSGFGKLAVAQLLERGHTVVVGLRGGEKRLRELFPHADPKRLVGLDLHIERPEHIRAAGDLIRQRFHGRLDVLINNAGYGLFGPLEEMSPEQLRRQMDVNFFGPAALIREVLPMLRESRGRIINVSSVAGRFAFPYYGAYNSSKFALEALSEALHYELKPLGVQVALVEPGSFKTDFSNRSFVMAEGALRPESPYYKRASALGSMFGIAMSRGGNPDRVARLIVRLCEKERIPLRNLIGKDAWGMQILARLVPDFVRVALVERGFRMVIFRD